MNKKYIPDFSDTRIVGQQNYRDGKLHHTVVAEGNDGFVSITSQDPDKVIAALELLRGLRLAQPAAARAIAETKKVVSGPPVPRIGDVARDKTIDRISRACADGQLNLSEMQIRIDLTLAATTQPQLDVLLVDIPELSEPASTKTIDRLSDENHNLKKQVIQLNKRAKIQLYSYIIIITLIIFTAAEWAGTH